MSTDFGDLRRGNFSIWWRATGRSLFAEAKRPAKVIAINLEALQDHRFDVGKLYLEIPLTIRKQTIIKQFKQLLDEQHAGRALNLIEHSQAKYKLHTKRYRLHTIETEYWVLLYRLLYPNIEIWRIGDRLRIAPQHRMDQAPGFALTRSKNSLNALIGRHYYKARFTILNLERGSFPNSDDIDLSERHQPFGIAHQKEYRAATQSGAKGEPSSWQIWLEEQFHTDLTYEILRRNRLEEAYRMPDGKLRRRFAAFVAGTSDLLY